MSIKVTDLQFSGSDPTSAKLRRLVQDIQAAEAAINTLIGQVTTLQADTGETSQVFATKAGLSSNFTVSGLTKGQVLTALSATSAAFEALTLQDLSNVFIDDPENGQVLTFENNSWVAKDLPGANPVTGGESLGDGAPVYAGMEGSNLAFRSIKGDGSSIEVIYDGDTITLSATVAALSFAQASIITSIRI